MKAQSFPWQAAPNCPQLLPDEVHVWRARLTVPGTYIQSLYQLLSADELQRAERLRRPIDRERFVVARGTLRLLIAVYLSEAPGAISFQYAHGGKPTLVPASGLQFNLTHSHDLALFAFALDRRIGIDLERIISNPDPLPAACLLSIDERAALQQIAPEERVAAFYRCWTRKEAFVKARGNGVALPFDSFAVSLTASMAAVLLSVRDDPDEPGRWSLRSLQPAAGYTAALAVEGTGWRLHCWDWSAPVMQSYRTVTPS